MYLLKNKKCLSILIKKTFLSIKLESIESELVRI
ncbi:MAG: hypothetical protein PWR03_401 [Tenuifilum sp.]|jgi:hypothetical protein|nr:hypothetical protein [Tenuifilum sp.]